MRLRHCLPIIAALILPAAHGTSKLPPRIPLLIDEQQVVADLQPLLAETNNVEISRVFLCRRTGSQCYQTVWDIDLPKGWREPRLELLGHYPGATIHIRSLEALQVGGSYILDIFFHERSRWNKQTVSSTGTEFCLEGSPGSWRLLDHTACLARRNAEDRQGATP